MKYRGDISGPEYAAMEDGYEQGIAAAEEGFKVRLQAAQAEAWDNGHLTLCRRHGAGPPRFEVCRNPYRDVPGDG